MAQYVAPFVATPLFVAEGMYDSWQLGNVLKLGCGAPTPQKTCDVAQLAAFYRYGALMNTSVAGAVLGTRPGVKRGAFLSACIVHCQTIYNEGQDRWDACQTIYNEGQDQRYVILRI